MRLGLLGNALLVVWIVGVSAVATGIAAPGEKAHGKPSVGFGSAGIGGVGRMAGAPIQGFTPYGGAWEVRDGVLHVGPGQGHKLL